MRAARFGSDLVWLTGNPAAPNSGPGTVPGETKRPNLVRATH